MKAPAIDKKPTAQKKKASTKKASAALATCPVNGAGWCPYPFTVEQLERKLREKAEAEAERKSRAKGV